jgi:hypothetical protein
VPGTIANAGYEFYYTQENGNGFSPAPSDLPGYAITTPVSDQFGNGNDSFLTIAGTQYYTGFAQASASPASDPAVPGEGAVFDTIQLTDAVTPVPTSFVLGLLLDNSYKPGNGIFSLNLYSGDPTAMGTTLLASTPVSTPTGDTGVNHFYLGQVNGATSGEYITVTATNPQGGFVTLGGITFDPVTTPEPSTWALMLGGLAVLVSIVRFRQRTMS